MKNAFSAVFDLQHKSVRLSDIFATKLKRLIWLKIPYLHTLIVNTEDNEKYLPRIQKF